MPRGSIRPLGGDAPGALQFDRERREPSDSARRTPYLPGSSIPYKSRTAAWVGDSQGSLHALRIVDC